MDNLMDLSYPNDFGDANGYPGNNNAAGGADLLAQKQEILNNMKSSVRRSFFQLVFDIQLYYDHRIFISVLQLIVPVFQMYVLHLWRPYTLDLYKEDNSIRSFVYNSFSILTINSPANVDTHNITPQIIAISIFIIVTIVMFLIAHFDYQSNSHISALILKIHYNVYHILLLWLILPSFQLLGSSINSLNSGLNIFFFILSILYLIYVICLFIFVINYLTYLASPSRSFAAEFSGNNAKYNMFMNGFLIVLAQISLNFNDVAKYVVIGFSLVIHTILLLHVLILIPYVTILGNSMATSYYSMVITSDILTIFINTETGAKSLNLYCPILAMIFAFILFYYYFTFYVRILSKKLDATYENNRDADFSSLCTSYYKVIIYMRGGFISNSFCIFNGDYLMYFANKFNTLRSWFLAAEIVALIPGNYDLLNRCLMMINKYPANTLLLSVRLSKIHNILKLRQTQGSLQLTDTWKSLYKSTHESISLVKTFWLDIYQHRLLGKSNMTGLAFYFYNIKKRWDELISVYSYDAKMADLYSTFLIECLGSFEEGVRWLMKSERLKDSPSKVQDKLFRNFVRTKPDIIKCNIVTRDGFISEHKQQDNKNLRENTLEQTLALDSSTETRTNDQLDWEIDAAEVEKASDEIFLYAGARMVIEKITSNFRFKGIGKIRIVLLFALLLILVLLSIIFIHNIECFREYKLIYDQLSRLSTADASTSLISLGLELAKSINSGLNVSLYYSLFPNDETIINLEDNVISITELLDTSGELLHEYFLDYAENSYTFLPSLLFERFIELNICTLNVVNPTQSQSTPLISPYNIIMKLLYLQYNFTYVNNFSDLITDENFCFYLTHKWSLCQIIDLILDNYTDYSESTLKSIKQKSKIFIITYSVSYIIFVPCIFVSLSYIKKFVNKIFLALINIEPDYAYEASLPINLSFVPQKDHHPSTLNESSRFTFLSILCRVVIVCSIMFLFSVPLGLHFYLSSTADSISNVIRYGKAGERRRSIANYMMGMILMAYNSAEIEKKSLTQDLGIFNVETITNTYHNFKDLLLKQNQLFIYGENNDGLITYSEDIRNLHLNDICSINVNGYSCYGLENLLSSYIVKTEEIVNKNESINSEMFMESINMLISHINYRLIESSKYTSEVLYKMIDKSEIIFIVVYVILIILLLLLFFAVFCLFYLAELVIRTLMILINHLPPRVIVESKELYDILFGSVLQGAEEVVNTHKIIFDNLQFPEIIVSKDLIIEVANQSLLRTYDIKPFEIVGRRLFHLILLPKADKTKNITLEEQNALNLKSRLPLLLEDKSTSLYYRVDLNICDDQKCVVTKSDIKVYSFSNSYCDLYLISLHPNAQIHSTNEALNKIKEKIELLRSEMIPRVVSSYVTNQNTINFVSDVVTFLSVKIRNASKLYRNGYLNNVYTKIKAVVSEFPQFIFMNFINETVIFIGGLFSFKDDLSHAETAIKISLRIRELLNDFSFESDDVHDELHIEKLGEKFKVFYSVGIITSGPVFCNIRTQNGERIIEIYSYAIDDIVSFTDFVPSEICVSIETYELAKCKLEHSELLDASGYPYYILK